MAGAYLNVGQLDRAEQLYRKAKYHFEQAGGQSCENRHAGHDQGSELNRPHQSPPLRLCDPRLSLYLRSPNSRIGTVFSRSSSWRGAPRGVLNLSQIRRP
jgi:hypothetical protein